MPNTYVKVFGTYRLFKDEVVIVGHFIEQVKDHNEVTNHMLRVFAGQQSRAKGPIPVEELSTVKPRGSAVSESKIEETVLEAIKKLISTEGLQFVDMRNVFPRCRSSMTQDQFDSAVRSLEQQGTLYSAGEDHVYGTTD